MKTRDIITLITLNLLCIIASVDVSIRKKYEFHEALIQNLKNHVRKPHKVPKNMDGSSLAKIEIEPSVKWVSKALEP